MRPVALMVADCPVQTIDGVAFALRFRVEPLIPTNTVPLAEQNPFVPLTLNEVGARTVEMIAALVLPLFQV